MNIRPHIPPGRFVTTTLALLLALGPVLSSALAASLEYQLKAAFLLNFTRYIEWPGRPHKGDFNLCVIGPDVFGTALDEVAANRMVNGRRIVVRKNASVSEAARCDLVYLSMTDTRQICETLQGLESSSALTVGEGAGFLRMGGMIAFAPQDGKLRFYINAGAAERSGITISSRLRVLGGNPRDEGERRR